jgi:hypothetical protein
MELLMRDVFPYLVLISIGTGFVYMYAMAAASPFINLCLD